MEKETKKNMDKIGSGGDVPQRTLNCRKTRGLFMAKAQSHRKQETRKMYPQLAQRTIGSSAQVDFPQVGEKKTQRLPGGGAEGTPGDSRGGVYGVNRGDPQACQPSGRSKPERQWSVFPIRVKQEDADRWAPTSCRRAL